MQPDKDTAQGSIIGQNEYNNKSLLFCLTQNSFDFFALNKVLHV